MEEPKKEVNPYLDKIFSDWFKNIVILIVIISGLILLIFSLYKNWIDKDFSIDLLFFIMGIIIGKWLENGKK